MKITTRKILLFPFSLLYGIVVCIRNALYGAGILPSVRFNHPVISIGNLSAGGSGKTPHVEFLINILRNDYRVAMLSRGYKRKTHGFVKADISANCQTIGDEPFQVFRKFSDITVAVDENRVRGVKKLLKTARPPQVFLLDDAFQHRRISPGLSLLLTDYSSLYTHDSLLPGGNLRECKNASNRADIVVVTKCPDDISALNMRLVQKLIPIKSYQSLFFSTFVYGTIQPAFGEKLLVDITFKQLKERNYSVLLLAAIANPSLMLNYLKQFTNNIESIFYRDHHFFSGKDIKRIEEKFESLPTKNKIIITTEKDAARMDENFPNSLKYNIYTLPVTVKFINNQEQTFINKIKNYVAEDSRNS